jgi:hypothetical protein
LLAFLSGTAMNAFALSAKRILTEGRSAVAAFPDRCTDYRSAVYRWEDALFEQHPQGHRILTEDEACRLIREIFIVCERPAPVLELVPGFTDPAIGGYADVARNRILIEIGSLYAYLVLHEVAHILVPEDRQHGPAFTYVLQNLYRSYLDIPDGTVRALLEEHGLPIHTARAN